VNGCRGPTPTAASIERRVDMIFGISTIGVSGLTLRFCSRLPSRYYAVTTPLVPLHSDMTHWKFWVGSPHFGAGLSVVNIHLMRERGGISLSFPAVISRRSRLGRRSCERGTVPQDADLDLHHVKPAGVLGV